MVCCNLFFDHEAVNNLGRLGFVYKNSTTLIRQSSEVKNRKETSIFKSLGVV